MRAASCGGKRAAPRREDELQRKPSEGGRPSDISRGDAPRQSGRLPRHERRVIASPDLTTWQRTMAEDLNGKVAM